MVDWLSVVRVDFVNRSLAVVECDVLVRAVGTLTRVVRGWWCDHLERLRLNVNLH